MRPWAPQCALELISQFDHQPDIVSALAFDRTGNTLHLARLNGSTATERIRETGDAITTAKAYSPRTIAENLETAALCNSELTVAAQPSRHQPRPIVRGSEHQNTQQALKA